jgi:hypothetical protein
MKKMCVKNKKHRGKENGSGWAAVFGTVGKRRLKRFEWYQNHIN